MTILSRIIIFSVAFYFIFITALQGHAEEANKYEQWNSPDDRLEKMISDLDLIIEEGINSRAAHPDFLKDLQTTIDQYRTPQKNIYFSDDFSDNDFSSNPTWTVSTGEYVVDRYGSLYSSIAIRRPVPSGETGEESDSDRNLRILFGVINELSKDENDDSAAAEDAAEQQAVIYSNAAIPNSFNMQFSFRSDANWGSTSIGLFQGDDPKSGYHLVYQASPADDRPMQLIKYRYGKPYIIEEVRENTPALDDGLDHKIQLNRDINGDMVVTVDEMEVLRSSDLLYKDDFSGVVIMNSGGSYSYDNIEIYIEQ